MSVKVTVQLSVNGIDDPELVEDALLAGRSSYWRDEFDDALWQACKNEGLNISDVDIARVWIEADDHKPVSGSNG
jgi:hypothetical protein